MEVGASGSGKRMILLSKGIPRCSYLVRSRSTGVMLLVFVIERVGSACRDHC